MILGLGLRHGLDTVHLFFKKGNPKASLSYWHCLLFMYALYNLIDFCVSLVYKENRLFVVWDCMYLPPSLRDCSDVNNEEFILVHFGLKIGWFKGNASVLNS